MRKAGGKRFWNMHESANAALSVSMCTPPQCGNEQGLSHRSESSGKCKEWESDHRGLIRRFFAHYWSVLQHNVKLKHNEACLKNVVDLMIYFISNKIALMLAGDRFWSVSTAGTTTVEQELPGLQAVIVSSLIYHPRICEIYMQINAEYSIY